MNLPAACTQHHIYNVSPLGSAPVVGDGYSILYATLFALPRLRRTLQPRDGPTNRYRPASPAIPYFLRDLDYCLDLVDCVANFLTALLLTSRAERAPACLGSRLEFLPLRCPVLGVGDVGPGWLS